MHTFVAPAASAPRPGRILAILQVAAVTLGAGARLVRGWLAAHAQDAADRRALASMSRRELRDIGLDVPDAADPYSRSLADFRGQP
jgi:uncharacterized protein YjiS (DUF1127 family)